MNKSQRYSTLIDILSEKKIYPNKKNLDFYFKTLFKRIDFKNKKVLDIGGGSGILSLYASIMGAKKVVILEPIAEGYNSKMHDRLELIKDKTESNNIELLPITFQEYQDSKEKFDVIMLYNSINHLEETACKSLQYDNKSYKIYSNLFKKMNQMANIDCKISISDCSRYNFFGLIGVTNPFEPNIDWEIHQSPYFWSKMLREQGFKNPEISWNSFNTLRSLGKILLGNRFCSYFLGSHFSLTMNI